MVDNWVYLGVYGAGICADVRREKEVKSGGESSRFGGKMRTRKDIFKETCPICWEAMERRGKINGKPLYICPICGMATDGRQDEALRRYNENKLA